ncbi:MAG: T9SS type A sorting domain-containing protein [Ignavibacteriaceae bacterium]|nr:T9SS type A sorting domain-containing protein [Ignavibacteriaceae bacterium]
MVRGFTRLVIYFFFAFLFSSYSFAEWGFFESDRSWIGIKINTSSNSYTLWNDGTGTFHNTNLGFLSSTSNDFEITFWDVKTFKNSGSDVTGVSLWYRIYKVGGEGGAFIEVVGGFLQDLGSGNQKWGNTVTNDINPGNLDPNSHYYLEVYISANGTNPNETRFDSNNGINYRATFYTGPGIDTEAGLNMPGSYDSGNNPPTKNFLKTKDGSISLITTGDRRYQTRFNVASSGGDLVGGNYTMLFTSGPGGNLGQNKWAGVTVSMNTIQTYTYNSGADNGVTLTDGKYYVVNWRDIGYVNTTAIWMELSAAPVTITAVGHNNPGVLDAAIIYITLSGSKSAEERIFVRHTTGVENWSNSTFYEAEKINESETRYSATIPSGDIGDINTDRFYVLTTTVSSPDHATADMITINFSNDGGLNYSLPVELTSFNALVLGKTVRLSWNTATETENYGFEVERSTDKESWTKLGFLEGAGNSNSPKDYNYSDATVTNGKYYYRLKQIDYSGSYEYSKTLEVDMNKPVKFELTQNFPNPFNPATTISFSTPNAVPTTLKVYDAAGSQVAELFNSITEAGMKYQLEFNANDLSSGTYFYELRAGEFREVRKMLLLK